MTNKESNILLNETVIKGGYCIGCGACASTNDSPFEMKVDKYGQLRAELNSNKLSNDSSTVDKVCPFSDASKDEYFLGKELFGSNSIYDDRLGFIEATYAGYVQEDSFREDGSSGGMGTWILAELLKEGLVDNVVHVGMASTESSSGMLFNYSISKSVDEVKVGSKSRYYPVELSKVIDFILNHEGKYAIIGVPCFVKAIRLLCRENDILASRIKYCIGLVCGHLKSSHFASMWAWQVGIHPYNLKSFNFREKLEGYAANEYGISAGEIINGELKVTKSKPLKQMFGSNWGWGLFKYKACDFCDDVVAETADLTIGDAWLPQYLSDSKGTNVLIIRNREILQLLERAKKEERVVMDDVSPADVIRSQKSGFSHRREALAYRLFNTDKEGVWRPKKRVVPSLTTLSKKEKKIQDLRIKIVKSSHKSFQKALEKDSFQVFLNDLKPLINKYNNLYRAPLFVRIVNRIRKKIGI